MTAIGDQSPSGAKPRSGFDAKHASAGAVGNRPETGRTLPNIPQIAGSIVGLEQESRG